MQRLGVEPPDQPGYQAIDLLALPRGPLYCSHCCGAQCSPVRVERRQAAHLLQSGLPGLVLALAVEAAAAAAEAAGAAAGAAGGCIGRVAAAAAPAPALADEAQAWGCDEGTAPEAASTLLRTQQRAVAQVSLAQLHPALALLPLVPPLPCPDSRHLGSLLPCWRALLALPACCWAGAIILAGTLAGKPSTLAARRISNIVPRALQVHAGRRSQAWGAGTSSMLSMSIILTHARHYTLGPACMCRQRSQAKGTKTSMLAAACVALSSCSSRASTDCLHHSCPHPDVVTTTLLVQS
eukprot:774936-Pelagomonas_calceolata.AAC.3